MDRTLAPAVAAKLVTRPFVLLTASSLLFFLGVGVLLPTLPRLVRNELGGSDTDVGLIAAAYGAAAIACRPLLAWWTSRRGHRSALRAGALLGCVVTALLAPVDALWLVVGLRMLAGTAEALFFVGSATIINEGAPPHRRAEAASLNSVGVFAGIGFGPVLGRELLAAGHTRAPFLAAGALMALGAVCAFSDATDHRDARAADDGSWRARLRRSVHPAGVVPGIALALAIAGYVGWAGFLSLRADEIGGVNDGAVFLLYSAITLTVRLLGAKLPERLGLGRCVVSALTLLTSALTAAWLVDGAAGLWASAALMGVGLSLLYPSLLALTVNRLDDAADRAGALSSFTMFFEVGGILGGVVTGVVAGWLGYQAAFGVGALVTVAAAPVVWFGLLRPRRRAGPIALT